VVQIKLGADLDGEVILSADGVGEEVQAFVLVYGRARRVRDSSERTWGTQQEIAGGPDEEEQGDRWKGTSHGQYDPESGGAVLTIHHQLLLRQHLVWGPILSLRISISKPKSIRSMTIVIGVISEWSLHPGCCRLDAELG